MTGFLKQFGLPQVLHSITSSTDVPDDIWLKIEEFQKKGAAQNFASAIAGTESLKQMNTEVLNVCKQTLDGEENEELGTEFVKSFESSENVQDVEEVGCTVVGRADLKNREDDPVLPLKHRTGVKAAILESKARGACVGEYRTKISFVEDIVAMDSLWDWEGKESRNENLKEEVGQEMVKEEEIGSEEELKDVVTISIENCTVLNLDVVLDAPEIFNIPGNLKEQVPDEFSTPPSETKPAKKRGRSSKGSKGKRSKQ